MTKLLTALFAIIAGVAWFFLAAVAINALVAVLTMILWNMFVPVVLGGAYISFWPAFGLTGLFRLIGLSFKGSVTVMAVPKEGRTFGR